MGNRNKRHGMVIYCLTGEKVPRMKEKTKDDQEVKPNNENANNGHYRHS